MNTCLINRFNELFHIKASIFPIKICNLFNATHVSDTLLTVLKKRCWRNSFKLWIYLAITLSRRCMKELEYILARG